MMVLRLTAFCGVCAFLGFAISPMYVYAAEAVPAIIDIMPAHNATGERDVKDFKDEEATHPTLRVTPDKSEIINLDRAAASVIIGNPEHANIVADSSTRLVVIPRTPGATYFSALDKDGKVIMQRHVIIASPKEGYLRVKRSCINADGTACADTSVFYCPDMCHEIGSQEVKDSKPASAASSPAMTNGNSDQSSSDDGGAGEGEGTEE